MTRQFLRRIVSSVLVSFALTVPILAQGPFTVHNLVSDGFPPAAHTDPYLVNAWGLARSPGGPWLVGAADSSYARFYGSTGEALSPLILVAGNPTGIVSYGGSGFVITLDTLQAPARFLFASEGGIISGWNPNAPAPMSQFAIVAINNSASEANYKAITLATTSQGDRLYATDFHNARVDVFDGSFAPVQLPGAFVDPGIPAGYAPFGIRRLGNLIYVTYGMQDADAEDAVNGPGLGFVSSFTFSGAFVARIASGGALNAPWGLTMAPRSFGRFSGALMVGNFGDGRINVFQRFPVRYRGFLRTADDLPIEIDGLWAIDFGNGGAAGPATTLFFTAGPAGETHGLFGSITQDGVEDQEIPRTK